MGNPLVTIYIPTFNRVHLLKRAVESVLNQTYENLEIIVVDDGSTDATHEYLLSASEADKRLSFYIRDVNSGACRCRNIAIEAAKGEFITGLDDDDYFLPTRVANLVKSWYDDRGEGCIALYTNILTLKDSNTKKESNKIEKCDYNDLLFGNRIGNQLFTKTKYLKEVGGFDKKLSAWQDLECWFSLLKHFNGYASLVPNSSYVVDESHPHERITTRKTSAVLESYDYICHKHSLKDFERKVLKLQLHPYTGKDLHLDSIISSFLYFRKPHNKKRSWSLLVRYIKGFHFLKN